ncbi:hypothetical protein BDY24DRAFT_381345 [Mrakia frigida]|uniref:uncharacterized protein n=1 Tax=Mrakia frigida TaxID=29902 RepID=UPI003FCC1199
MPALSSLEGGNEENKKSGRGRGEEDSSSSPNLHPLLAMWPSLLLPLLSLVPLVNAHGFIASHKTRMPGEASKAICGEEFNAHWNGSKNGNDIYGPIFPRDLPSECKWFLCRGMQFEDNQENVYTIPANSPVHIEIFVLAGHAGTANLSVVDVERNEVISGAQLRYWGKGAYAHDTLAPPFPPSNEIDFVEDMPDLLGRCQRPGECVLQWWWWGKEAARDQYFESCIDFVQPPSLVASSNDEAQVLMDASSFSHHHP